MSEDYQSALRTAILDEHKLIRATFSGVQHKQSMTWVKLVIRPVLIKQVRHWQFSWFDARQNFVKNYGRDQVATALDDAFALPFANVHIQTTEETLQLRISKKGKPLLSRHAQAESIQPDLNHDRQKQTLINLQDSAPYLQAVGIMTQDGKIRADMRSKYTQIREFLRLLDESGAFADGQDRPLAVVDAGCGNAYLTFAMYHYLRYERGWNVEMIGIDHNQRLIANHADKVTALGWDQLRFEACRIEDYSPEPPPEVVIALHACDTATDDAIALGIRAQSRVIVVAPCCHHHLQAQLNAGDHPAPFDEVLRYGLMLQRTGDILTDSFRALLLRIAGYRVEMVEFVGTEHTPKNLMLRAIKTHKAGDARLIEEYEQLKAFWRVTPYLETLIKVE
ncbi:MAG: SAM-dependent methyltransferase [Anaerolineae bacterium]|jgi:SAM-dependent methyltransferase|nr:SAM-dependent methyltransferase [Anaerolineae bacterium]